MASLRTSPYNLVEGDLIQARIKAENVNGWGDISEVNIIGATVQDVPGTMTAPVKGSATTTTVIQVNWSAASDNGGATIDSYNL